jgi:hypothetical protein
MRPAPTCELIMFLLHASFALPLSFGRPRLWSAFHFCLVIFVNVISGHMRGLLPLSGEKAAMFLLTGCLLLPGGLHFLPKPSIWEEGGRKWRRLRRFQNTSSKERQHQPSNFTTSHFPGRRLA